VGKPPWLADGENSLAGGANNLARKGESFAGGASSPSEVGLIDLLIVSVGAARGREKPRAMGEAQGRWHGPLLHFNQLNPPPALRVTGRMSGQGGIPTLERWNEYNKL